MAEPLDFDEFMLSVPPDGLSLFVSSHLFLADQFNPQIDLMGVYENVESGQLRILPSTVHLQMDIRVDGAALVASDANDGFLEFLAESICQSPLWPSLGLSAMCTEITYETNDDDRPNIYLEVDHPDKAASLISPPESITTSIEGLFCRLDYRPIGHGRRHHEQSKSQQSPRRVGNHRAVDQPLFVPNQSNDSDDDRMQIGDMLDSQDEIDETCRRRRECTEQLTIAALYRMIGIKPRLSGIQGITPISPTLLDIAPAMWNAHYMELTRHHARQLPLIVNIIENAGTWRRTLQDKITTLSNENNKDPHAADDEQDPNRQHNPLHQHLWTLLRSNLRNKINIQPAAKKAHCSLGTTPDDAEAQHFSSDASSRTPEDKGAELLDYEYDDWEQDESQLSPSWAVQLENDISDYEPSEAELDFWSASTYQKPQGDEFNQEDNIVDGMENEDMLPDSQGLHDDWAYDDINPEPAYVRKQFLQSGHLDRG
ncbi:hypothetical protein PG993_007659 [Apiospora rasikravindrae]|uniref:Uncharacterized protein n=1 Tax=Apiospora rasikravindrae TaxID=990691 RepID=A0ABR1SY49_9PEZI